MPVFRYIAKMSPTRKISGYITADSIDGAGTMLIDQGCFPTRIDPVRQHECSEYTIQRVDVAMFTYQLSELIGSGLDLSTGLETMAKQTEKPALKRMIWSLVASIKRGASFSNALQAYSGVFSPFYIAMIQAAEAGGTFQITLKQLAEYTANQNRIRSEIIHALAYPFFVLGLGIVTIGVLVAFVVPKLSVLFAENGATLPAMTRYVLFLSHAAQTHWLGILAGIAGINLGFYYFARMPGVSARLDDFALRVPLWRDALLKVELQRFCKTLAMLIRGGIPLVSALTIARNVLTNRVLQNRIGDVHEQVSKGARLAPSLARAGCPPMAVTIIAGGEKSGNVENAFAKINDMYASEISAMVKTGIRVLEPAMILVVGVVVGVIVFAMLLPVFEMDILAR